MGIGESFLIQSIPAAKLFKPHNLSRRTIQMNSAEMKLSRESVSNEYAQIPSTFINLSDESCYSIYDHRSFYLTQTNIQSRWLTHSFSFRIRFRLVTVGLCCQKG